MQPGWSRSTARSSPRTPVARRTSTTSGSPARSSPRPRATDEAEDELFGEARGDELPEELRTSEGRRRWLARGQARAGVARQADRAHPRRLSSSAPRSLPRCRAAGRSTRAAAAGCATPASASTSAASARRARSRARAQARLAESRRRLEEELAAEREANEAYEAYRARGICARRAPLRRRAAEPPPAARHAGGEDQHDRPRLAAAQGARHRLRAGLQRAGGGQRTADRARRRDLGRLTRLRAPRADGRRDRHASSSGPASPTHRRWSLADAGYWHHEQMDSLAADGIQVLIPPDAEQAQGRPARLARAAATSGCAECSRPSSASGSTEQRSQTVEPMFGHTKHNRGMSRFHRRGRSAARTEWRLITATHNLTKLHSHTLAPATA